MIENLISGPPRAGALLCFLGDRRDGGAGLFCFVLVAPDQAAVPLQFLPELSQLTGPCLQPPCRVVRITGKAAHEDIQKLLRDLSAERHNLRSVAINRNGRFLIDIEVAEEPPSCWAGPRQADWLRHYGEQRQVEQKDRKHCMER
jgi:hypothetical protein